MNNSFQIISDGSYNAACNARMILLDDYPEAKITVIDSAVITGLQGIFVGEAVRMRDNECA